MQGRIFNIQRYSTQDGPGIRTNVFLSGCSLRCQWCANPESWSQEPELFFTDNRCIGCMQCVQASKNREITAEKNIPIIDRNRSQGKDMWAIAKACPTGAMTVKQRDIDATELMEIVMKDHPFYQRSGGGVTFSGGEPLLQSDFVLEMLCLLKKEHIHTAIETAGNIPWESIKKVASYTDLFLYDIKCMDPNCHEKFTGSTNEQILENLIKLRTLTDKIHVRVPVIPGFNDNVLSLKKIRRFLNQQQISQRTLLPFHQYGSSKYKAIGLPYLFNHAEQMKKEKIEKLANESNFYNIN